MKNLNRKFAPHTTNITNMKAKAMTIASFIVTDESVDSDGSNISDWTDKQERVWWESG